VKPAATAGPSAITAGLRVPRRDVSCRPGGRRRAAAGPGQRAPGKVAREPARKPWRSLPTSMIGCGETAAGRRAPRAG